MVSVLHNIDVVFRLDANKQVGAGHFMRAMALIERLVEAGYQLAIVGDIDSYYAELAQALSVGVFDSNQRISCKALIIDHYAPLDNLLLGWDKHIAVIVFEDLTSRYSERPVTVINAMGDSKVLSACYPNANILTGLQYLLFRRQVEFITRANISHGDVNIVISLGGSEQSLLLKQIVNLIKNSIQLPLNISVFSNSAWVNNEGVCVYPIPSSEFVAKLSQADCIISAAGQTFLELVYRQLSVIGIAIADNQLLCAKQLEACGIPVIIDISKLEKDLPRRMREVCSADYQPVATVLAQSADQLLEHIERLIR